MDRTAADYQKDLLWQTALETFYRVAYTESLMTSALQKWRPVDGVVKSTVTITTIASVMVGWMAWGTPAGKVTWLLIAGCAAFLALLHVILKISDRVTDLSHNAQYFKSLRLNLERFIYEMEANPDFPLEQFKRHLNSTENGYWWVRKMLKDDFLLTRRHRQKVQES